MGKAIFISYRRDDSEGEAGRLFDDLVRAFDTDSVFMDVAGISPGVDFRQAIEQNVASCGVLLAVIGPSWVSITNPAGVRRLDDPNDFVGLEIASALKRQVPVIPVLVHEARMPSPDQLPDGLKELSYRNSVELTHARWNSDVALLLQALASYVKPETSSSREPVHATVPVQLPPVHPAPATSPQPAASSRRPLYLGILGAVVALTVLIVVIVHFVNVAEASKETEAEVAAMTGTWHDPVIRPNNSLTSLVIAGTSKSLSMHAFGSCQPAPCDWGTTTATYDTVDASATFHPPTEAGVTRNAEVSVHINGNELDVTVHNTFTEQEGTHENEVHRLFVRGE